VGFSVKKGFMSSIGSINIYHSISLEIVTKLVTFFSASFVTIDNLKKSNMTEPAIIFNRVKKLDKQGRARVEIRVVLGSQAEYFYTQVKVKPEDWDEAKLKVKNKPSIGHIKLNNQIRDIQGEIGKIIERYTREGSTITRTLIKRELEPEKAIPDICFHNFMETEIDKRNDVCADTKRLHRKSLEVLKKYAPEILMKDINFKLIQGFEYFLIERGLGANTRGDRYHKHFKLYINRAIQQDLYDKVNPYSKGFKMPSSAVNREALTQQELKDLEKLTFEPDLLVLERVRDAFLFACYTGMRLGDWIRLEKEWIKIEGDEMYMTFKPSKAKSRWVMKFPLHQVQDGKPKAIILKYMGQAQPKFFPRMNEGMVNRNLKDIARMAGIEKKLHSHIGKITFITIAASLGISIDILSELTGTTTDTLRRYYKKVNPELRNLTIDKVKW
jgi:integrase